MLRDTVDSFIRIVGTLILVSIFTPWFLILLPIVVVLFYSLQEKYRKTTRELKRFDSTTRSPIYNNFSSCLNGMTTIHSYNQYNTWIDQHHDQSDNNFRFGYLVLTASRWSSIRFEFISHSMIAFVTLYISLSSNMSPGLAGAALMNITLINRSLMNAVRNYVQLEIGFNAVERIEDYTNNLPQEDSKSDPVHEENGKTSLKDWPKEGQIVFDQFQLRYREGLPLVLNNLNVTINGGEKIGVVGRKFFFSFSFFLF
jgi:ATP-binding cassette subfamily C (CFTR/MRP) protein 1